MRFLREKPSFLLLCSMDRYTFLYVKFIFSTGDPSALAIQYSTPFQTKIYTVINFTYTLLERNKFFIRINTLIHFLLIAPNKCIQSLYTLSEKIPQALINTLYLIYPKRVAPTLYLRMICETIGSGRCARRNL